jgi:hypothetical protein
MAAKDLITNARLMDTFGGLQGQANLTMSANETTTLNNLITAISDAIEKYCKRRFVSTAYDELYNGTGDRRIHLRQYPIQKVTSIRYRPVTVMKITNTVTANVQARVLVKSTGLELFRTSAGVSTTVTAGLDWVTNPTITALTAAVNALGSGWSAQAVGDSNNYGNWPSADLYVPGSYGDTLEGTGVLYSQGALTAVNGINAELKMHTYELQGCQWDPRGWLLRAIPYTDPELLHPEDLIWPVGINNFRIQYTAGYTTIPEAIQQACAEWVCHQYWQTKRDIDLVHQALNAGTAQAWGAMGSRLSRPPQNVQTLLAPYRRITVASGQS